MALKGFLDCIFGGGFAVAVDLINLRVSWMLLLWR